MSFESYKYEYHDMAQNADYIDQDDDVYYNNGTDEPWMDTEESVGGREYDAYYHDLTEEIDE